MPTGLKRKVIRIKAEDSPNVRYALAEIAAGREPSGRILVPGVKQYWEYVSNRRDWDPIQQCVSLDADWYEGAEVLMFPPAWLNLAEKAAERLRGTKRQALAIGVDTAEGGDDTAMAAVDEQGLIELQSKKTPDTNVVTGEVLAFMMRHGVEPGKVLFDRGGGGKWCADRLRSQGYAVRTVGFGETVAPPLKRRGVVKVLGVRQDELDSRMTYKNRRAEMYCLLRQRLDPTAPTTFALPREYAELRRQLAPIPLWYDDEGRIMLPPKSIGADQKDNANKVTIEKLIGCSPDQSDALVLAVYGLVSKTASFKVSSMT